MKKLVRIVLFFLLSLSFNSNLSAQETFPIYFDYISDNVFLLHPAAAGVGNAGKVRLTNHSQWQGVENAPALQTVSFHTRLFKNTGVGAIVFNDKNGFRAQRGLVLNYAYHLNLSKRHNEFEQLSFAFSLSYAQNQLNLTANQNGEQIFPISDSYFNGDFGMAYHKNGFFSYVTIKNLFLTTKTDEQLESLNLTKYIANAGYYFGENNRLEFEPSVMFLYEPFLDKKLFDANLKVYKNVREAKLWMAASYRFVNGGSNVQNNTFFSGLIGVNYKRFMLAYTHAWSLGDINIKDGAGYNQITLGYDMFVRKPRASACPNINSGFMLF